MQFKNVAASNVPSSQADANIPPTRVIFNFLTQCNMDCKFCYLDFGEPKTSLAQWIRIVDHLAGLGSTSLTFAGGDPFIYPDFPRLLRHAKNSNCFSFIQVDSNGICINSTHYQLLQENCDLLGLSLDGSNNAINTVMRGNGKHYDKVCLLLRELGRSGMKLKVNTVVCRKNLDDLESMAKMLKEFDVKIWSLYEFWSLGSAVSHATEYAISQSEFIGVAERLSKLAPFLKVEFGSVDIRKPSYFFVSHAGRVYTINREDAGKYVTLGNIFEADIVQRWNAQADRAQTEYRLMNRIQSLARF